MELRECPFCGCDEAGFGHGKDHVFVICPDCLASHVVAADMQKWDREMAIEEWNRRPDDRYELTDKGRELLGGGE